jgi:hypothetical protein
MSNCLDICLIVQLVDQVCEHSRMNLSTTMSAVAEDREDTVVDMWPQVSHKVHIIIGVFIVVSGETCLWITIMPNKTTNQSNFILSHFLYFLCRHLWDSVQHVPPHHPLQTEGEADGSNR